MNNSIDEGTDQSTKDRKSGNATEENNREQYDAAIAFHVINNIDMLVFHKSTQNLRTIQGRTRDEVKNSQAHIDPHKKK